MIQTCKKLRQEDHTSETSLENSKTHSIIKREKKLMKQTNNKRKIKM